MRKPLTLSPGSSLMGTARNGVGRIVCLMEETEDGRYAAHTPGCVLLFDHNNEVAFYLSLEFRKVYGYVPYVVWCGERNDVACGYEGCSTCCSETAACSHRASKD